MMRPCLREKRSTSAPRCGARLVTRNLSHSCGRFSLKALFSRANPETLALARKYIAAVRSLGNVQVLPQKTRLVIVARVRFASIVPRRDHFIALFALQRRLRSARIDRIIDYGPGWQMHEVRIRSAADLDAELLKWLTESFRIVGKQEK